MKVKNFKSKQIKEFLEHEFDFSQFKDTYDDWTKAFEKAVAKNAEDDCFTGLSSGYDSGSLTFELAKQGFKFKTYTIPNNENLAIIFQRLPKEYAVSTLSEKDFDRIKKHLEKNIVNDKYTIKYNGVETDMRILDDKASVGGAFMCELAQAEGRKVYLSTQGSDEIMSDYSLIPMQSEFKGTYPKDLKEWYNFKNGCNYSYLMKEERIPAVYGIETRYPFLDIDLVQEFLWLKAELKNRFYKAPLHNYLTKNNIPFEANVKRGFTL
jgi:asparagine synthetase B (glutamine-hydrolysing)